MRSGTDMVVLDSRPFDEYSRISIPTGINVPGAELVLRVRDIAPSPDTTDRRQLRRPHPQHHRRAIADQCRRAEQGRGAAQRHHGLASRRARPATAARPTRVAGRSAARPRLGQVARPTTVARKFGVTRIDRATLERFARRHDAHDSIFSMCATRPNTRPAIFPARSPHPAASWCRPPTICRHARRAHRAESTTSEVRAVMTASWLKQMGWHDVFVLPEAGDGNRQPRRPCSARRPRTHAVELLRPAGDRRRHRDRSLAQPGTTAAATFPAPGSPSARGSIGRWRKSRCAATWSSPREDGVLAGLAVAEARRSPTSPSAGSRAATPPGRPPAFRSRTEPRWPTSRSTSGSSPTSAAATLRRP